MIYCWGRADLIKVGPSLVSADPTWPPDLWSNSMLHANSLGLWVPNWETKNVQKLRLQARVLKSQRKAQPTRSRLRLRVD